MLTQHRRVAAFRAIPAVTWMGAIFYLSSQSEIPQPAGVSISVAAIIGHLVAYGALAILVLYAISGLVALAPSHYVIAFAIALVYGISDEFHQSFVVGRQATVVDVVLDAIGAVLALTIIAIVDRHRRP